MLRSFFSQIFGDRGLLSRLHKNQRGGIGLLLLVVIFAGLLLVPFFIDFSSLQYSRRIAQTGNDAGAMAGAKALAEDLSLARANPVGWTRWTDPSAWYRDIEAAKADRRKEAVRVYYTDYYVPALRSSRPRTSALQLAQANISGLADWQFAMTRSPRMTRVEGQEFWDMSMRVACQRPVELYGRDVYGKDLKTPATATSEVSLQSSNWRFETQEVARRWVCDVYCTTESGFTYCCVSHWEFRYRARVFLGDQWKIQLIR